MKRKVRADAGVGIMFLLVLIVFFVIQLFPSKDTYSKQENRNLAATPELTVDSFFNGTYQSGLESYMHDHFAARKTWMEVKTDTNILLGMKKQDDVYILDDMLAQDFIGCNEENLISRVESINNFYMDHSDKNVSFVLVPNKIGLYQDQFPLFSNTLSQQNVIDRFSYRLHKEINFLNSTDVLKAHKDEYIYYKSDHHWTTIGAKYIFDSWIQSCGMESKKLDYTSYPIMTDFVGALGNKIGYTKFKDTMELLLLSKNDEIKYIVTDELGNQTTSIYDSENIGKNPYSVFMGGNHAVLNIDTNVNNSQSILIFKDSYANSFIPFLLPYYSHITVVDPRYYYDDIETLIDKNYFDDVLFLYNVNTFFSDNNLQDLINK